MKIAEGFSVSVEDAATPQTWYEVENMTVKRAIYHYFKWHSTILNVADVRITTDDLPVQYFDSDRTSLYDAVDKFIRGGMVGETISDRQGIIWMEISPDATHLARTSLPTAMSLEKRDWRGDVNLTKRVSRDVSYVERGGIAYYGYGAGFSALLSCAPGNAPSYRGKTNQAEGLILTDQSQLNDLTGDIFAYLNSMYPEVPIRPRGYRTGNLPL
jgi:hypothetical protein